jgi:hypothetical protein
MKTQRLLLLVAIVAIAGLVTFADLPGGTRIWAEIQNACHAPAFGLLAVACLALIRHSAIVKSRHALLPYLIALAVAVGLGLMTELVQHFAGRDAEYGDVLRDALGALAFLALCLARDPALPKAPVLPSRHLRLALHVIAIVLLAGAFASLGLCAASYVARNQAFPTLADPTSAWSRQFIRLENAQLTPAPQPSEWQGHENSSAALLVLEPAEYPGLTLEEIYPDWTAYSTLRFELYSLAADTIILGLRIDDVHHDYSNDDRFTERLVIAPGANTIRINLGRVLAAPASRD